MGVLYRARDLKLDREVALKRPYPSLVPDLVQRQRFEREARAAAQLAHPHIVPIFEVLEQDGVPWIAMELVHGRSLRSLLDLGEPLPLPEVLRHAEAMAGALAGRPRARHPAPRRQPEEHHGHDGRPRAADRLRPGPGDARPQPRLRHDRDAGERRHARGRGAGHARLHVARAGAGPPGRSAQRPVLPGRGPVRDVHARARVLGERQPATCSTPSCTTNRRRSRACARTRRRSWSASCASCSRRTRRSATRTRPTWWPTCAPCAARSSGSATDRDGRSPPRRTARRAGGDCWRRRSRSGGRWPVGRAASDTGRPHRLQRAGTGCSSRTWGTTRTIPSSTRRCERVCGGAQPVRLCQRLPRRPRGQALERMKQPRDATLQPALAPGAVPAGGHTRAPDR